MDIYTFVTIKLATKALENYSFGKRDKREYVPYVQGMGDEMAMDRIRRQGGGAPTDAVLFIPSMIEFFSPSDGKKPLCHC